jgi:hypothetical protein
MATITALAFSIQGPDTLNWAIIARPVTTIFTAKSRSLANLIKDVVATEFLANQVIHFLFTD